MLDQVYEPFCNLHFFLKVLMGLLEVFQKDSELITIIGILKM